MIDSLITKRLSELPAFYQDFILSGFVSEAAQVLGDEAKLLPEQKNIFANSIMLFLLFFIEKSEVINNLVEIGVSEKEAGSLVAALHESLPEYAKQVEAITTDALHRDIEEYEAALKRVELEKKDVTDSLNTVRTMQKDVARIQQETPLHQSSQDALLRQSDTPVQQNHPPPRWDTE